MSTQSVLLVVTHLLGTGHLTRMAALGRGLARAGHRVTLVTGGRPLPLLDVAGVAVVQLPAVHCVGTDFRTLLGEDGREAGDALMANRRAALLEAFAAAAPDVVVTELFPFGRRQLAAEFEALLAAGKPLVFLHHAIAGWPTWDRYAEAIGTRFFYRPGSYKGRDYPDSGYRSAVRYEADVVAGHPVTEGLPERIAFEDELYLMPLLEPDVAPLVRARFDFVAGNFHSAAAAVEGRAESRDGWTHPPGTDLIAWARRAGRSPVVVIQCGNDGATFSNPAFERLLGNAVAWVTSPQAAAWAAGRDGSTP